MQVGYSTNNYKHTDKVVNIKGSAEFGNNYSVWGEYFYEKGDWNDPQEYETLKYDKLLIGFGKSFPVSSSVDITSSFSYDKWNSKKTTEFTAKSISNGVTTYTTTLTNSSYKYNLSEFSIGIKNLSTSGIEFHIKNNWGRLRGSSVTSSSYYIPSIAIRHISESGIESSAKYLKVKKLGGNPSQSRLELGLIKHINKSFAIGGKLTSSKSPDWTETGIFVRRSF